MHIVLLLLVLLGILWLVKGKKIKKTVEAVQFLGEIAIDPEFAGSLAVFGSLCRAYKAGTVTTAEVLHEMWTNHRAFMERYPNITFAMVKDEYERMGKAHGQ